MAENSAMLCVKKRHQKSCLARGWHHGDCISEYLPVLSALLIVRAILEQHLLRVCAPRLLNLAWQLFIAPVHSPNIAENGHEL